MVPGHRTTLLCFARLCLAAVDEELQHNDSVEEEVADVHEEHDGVLRLLHGREDARRCAGKVEERGDEGQLPSGLVRVRAIDLSQLEKTL